MNNNMIRGVAAAVALVILLVGGGLLYLDITGGSGEASREVTAPTLVPRTAAPAEAATEAATEAPTEAATVEVTEAATEETAAPTQEVALATEVAIEAAAPLSTDALFRIVKEESEVRFSLQEDLRGQRVTVVGVTNEVAGDILVDQANPANSVVGIITINMRTLATDNSFRNEAIRGQILLTARDEYEFSNFTPTSISGMPDSVEVGTAFTFTLDGTLDIKGVPQAVSFEVTVTPVSEDRIEGLGQAVVNWSDWGLSIPNVPGVANVTEEATLEIEFVAARVQ